MSRLSATITPDTLGTKPQEGGYFKDKIKNLTKRVSDAVGKFIPFSYDNVSKNTGFQEGMAKVIAGTAMTLGVASASASVEPPKKPQENVFEPAFQTVNTLKKPQENAFIPAFNPKPVATRGAKKLDELHVPRIPERDIERPLELGNLKQTDTFLKSMELPIMRKTKAYTTDGKYAEPMLKGTKIMLDASKPILIARDGKTYAYVSGHNSTGTDVIESLLIRTPWLDDKIRSEKVSKVAPKKNFFEGVFGYKDIIPRAALEEETKKYFTNVLGPKVQANIAKTDTAIMKTREEIKTEVLLKRKSIAEIPSYHEQKKALSKKYSLTKVNQAIQSFTVNGSDALVNPDVEQLLASLKKTPEWQKIIQAASAAENAKIRKRYRG